jgi:UDP-glucose 4-epimerase
VKVLVTGGAGFIGMNLCKAYLSKGYEVVVADNLSTGKEEHILDGVKFYKTDITESAFLEIVEKESPDIINHHAAQIDVQTSIHEPMLDAKINILGTINVLEACRRVNARLVYASSAAVYGTPDYLGVDEIHPVDPISSYGISKHTPEHYIKIYHDLYDVSYTILRYANVYGIGQDPKGEGGVISIFVDRVVRGEGFTIFGDGEQTRDYINVDDIVKANMLATEKPINTIVNVSTGIATSLNEVIEIFKEITSKEIDCEYKEERAGDIKHSYLLNSKAENELGFTFDIQLKEGLASTLEYYQSKYSKEVE